MRFWDASALVALLADEPSSVAMHRLLERDPHVAAWWATEVECVSALTRLEREGGLTSESMAGAFARLDELSCAWTEVVPGQRVRQIAVRLLRVHPLRTADSLQLAAAIVASEEQPRTLRFVTLDDRLAQAARREGFEVVAPELA